MKKIFSSLLLALIVCLNVQAQRVASSTDDSSQFVNITDVVPDVILEIRYFGTYNFVGARVDGYEQPTALMTRQAAKALKAVSDEVIKQGYRLKIYDAYRPQKGVDHFVRWAEDLADTKMKPYFYADLDKSVLFDQGYIAAKSGHTRGSTVDLTLFDMATEKELDMGGTFDWFGPESHPDFCGNPETGEYTGDNSKSPAGRSITEQQFKNRMILRKAMLGNGFKPIDTEWWHFTLKDEPFTETYFTFPVRELKNPKLTADDHLPSFPGGQEQLMMYLSKSIRYPEEAAKYGAQGKIVVSFMVNQDGTLDDFHIFESHVQCTSVKYKKLDNSIKAFQYNKCKEALEQEALRVAQDMPDWKPGVQYGKKIRVRYKLPITFRMR